MKSAVTFDGLPHTPSEHFKLYFYAALLHIFSRLSLDLSAGSHRPDAPSGAQVLSADEQTPLEIVFKHFPFLAGYINELAVSGLQGMTLDESLSAWREGVLAWESAAPQMLPISSLCRAASLDYADITLLVAIGLGDEDARFGPMFAAMQGIPAQHRPTIALLNAWWSEDDGYNGVRSTLRRLQELGLLEVTNPDAPRLEWAFEPCGLLWDALRGERSPRPESWCAYHPPEALPRCEDLVLPADAAHSLEQFPALFASGNLRTFIVRGPQHNGRHMLLHTLARAMGYGVLEINGFAPRAEARWKQVGPLASLLQAIPIVAFDLAPGETGELPALEGYRGPLGVVTGRQGGLVGPVVEHSLTLSLEIPNPAARRLLWQRSLGAETSPAELEAISASLRLTSGNIQRAAQLAHTYAQLAQRGAVMLRDVRQAARALNHQVFETLAQRLDTSGDWSQLSVTEETLRELRDLESRCRHRESLQEALGAAFGGQLNHGVRALFTGPSGSGKTLAARLLASVLQMDIYRIDLASVVNKYIGETEKNLNQVFARAEEQDVILLLDEGDALLTQRTSVQSSNDRYANLETNYLLQRIESFQGILVVTTNAADRIDSAFQRRMDVVVGFRLPDAAERWSIWKNHMPANHRVEERFLREVVNRCNLSGGQIRNAVLHASLLALESKDGQISTVCLDQAVRREYRKSGAICPLAVSGD